MSGRSWNSWRGAVQRESNIALNHIVVSQDFQARQGRVAGVRDEPRERAEATSLRLDLVIDAIAARRTHTDFLDMGAALARPKRTEIGIDLR